MKSEEEIENLCISVVGGDGETEEVWSWSFRSPAKLALDDDTSLEISPVVQFQTKFFLSIV